MADKKNVDIEEEIANIRRIIDSIVNKSANEKKWNGLISYLLKYGNKKESHFRRLLGDYEKYPKDFKVFYEGQPLSFSKNEGNTRIDLSFGAIKEREVGDGEKADNDDVLDNRLGVGIELDLESTKDYICFVDGKFLGDSGLMTDFDVTRNQMTRIIENLLCFQSKGVQRKDRLFFTLLTPRLFKENKTSRLYGFKYMEYYKDKLNIIKDIERKICIEEDAYADYIYPKDLLEPLDRLKLNWTTYEDILETEFEMEHGSLDLTCKDWDKVLRIKERINYVISLLN